MAQTRDNRTISEFKSRLLGGGARPNLFEVELTTKTSYSEMHLKSGHNKLQH